MHFLPLFKLILFSIYAASLANRSPNVISIPFISLSQIMIAIVIILIEAIICKSSLIKEIIVL